MEDSSYRPIRTPTISEKNTQADIKRSQNKPLNLADLQDHKIEIEDDTGKIQQVSGGFGESNQMDEKTIKLLKEN